MDPNSHSRVVGCECEVFGHCKGTEASIMCGPSISRMYFVVPRSLLEEIVAPSRAYC